MSLLLVEEPFPYFDTWAPAPVLAPSIAIAEVPYVSTLLDPVVPLVDPVYMAPWAVLPNPALVDWTDGYFY
jgi:hypothetical protein